MTTTARTRARSNSTASGLIDLTTTSLRELRAIKTPEFAMAIQRTIAEAASGRMTAIQEQNQ